jgi:hypothetical protein
MKGFDLILDRLRQDPSQNTLRLRYIALVTDLESTEDKIDAVIKLLSVYRANYPAEALELAYLICKYDPKNIKAIEIIIEIFERQGRAAQADLMKTYLLKLQMKSSEAVKPKSTQAETDGSQTQESGYKFTFDPILDLLGGGEQTVIPQSNDHSSSKISIDLMLDKKQDESPSSTDFGFKVEAPQLILESTKWPKAKDLKEVESSPTPSLEMDTVSPNRQEKETSNGNSYSAFNLLGMDESKQNNKEVQSPYPFEASLINGKPAERKSENAFFDESNQRPTIILPAHSNIEEEFSFRNSKMPTELHAGQVNKVEANPLIQDFFADPNVTVVAKLGASPDVEEKNVDNNQTVFLGNEGFLGASETIKIEPRLESLNKFKQTTPAAIEQIQKTDKITEILDHDFLAAKEKSELPDLADTDLVIDFNDFKSSPFKESEEVLSEKKDQFYEEEHTLLELVQPSLSSDSTPDYGLATVRKLEEEPVKEVTQSDFSPVKRELETERENWNERSRVKEGIRERIREKVKEREKFKEKEGEKDREKVKGKVKEKEPLQVNELPYNASIGEETKIEVPVARESFSDFAQDEMFDQVDQGDSSAAVEKIVDDLLKANDSESAFNLLRDCAEKYAGMSWWKRAIDRASKVSRQAESQKFDVEAFAYSLLENLKDKLNPHEFIRTHLTESQKDALFKFFLGNPPPGMEILQLDVYIAVGASLEAVQLIRRFVTQGDVDLNMLLRRARVLWHILNWYPIQWKSVDGQEKLIEILNSRPTQKASAEVL